jgi:dTDP-4-dehydrorhamnose 3,5-epimerase-like enzyme
VNIYNVFENSSPNLEVHTDDRGTIADVFFSANINHVALITSRTGAIRGNHYHLETIQSILITKGSLEYWYATLDDPADAKMVVARIGDVVTSGKSEIHTMRMLEDTDFIAFTQGKRGGSDYESDTYRVASLLN